MRAFRHVEPLYATVSRLLGSFESRRWVKLERILASKALADYTHQP